MHNADISVSAPASGSLRAVESAAVVDPGLNSIGTGEDTRTGSIDSLLRRVFSFPAMLGTFLVGRVFYEARAFFVDPDLWWHIKAGQNILATHQWPTTDPFSYTVAGQPWMAYEWLGDVLFGAVARFGGLLGLEILLFGLASAVMLALYAYTTLRSGNSKAGFVSAGVLCSLAFASFNMRPQMIGYLFLVFTLIALERFRRGKERSLWFLPAMFLLWVNVHGSFIIGIGVLLVYLVAGVWEFRVGGIVAERWTAAQRVRLELVLLLSIAVLPLTPYGARVAVYPFDMAFGQPVNVGNVLEWQPMPFAITGGKLFLAMLMAFLVAQILWRFAWGLAEIVLCCGGIVMACLHVRFLMLFVPFSAPIFAVMLARWLPPYEKRKDHPILNAVLMAGVIIAMARYFPTRSGLEKIVSETYPLRAVQYLRQHPVPGPLFNTYGYGGYLIEELPEQKVFIDGRGDVYERAGIFSEYLEVADIKPGAFQVLRVHGIQSCLLESKEPLAVVLAAQPEWEKRYADGVSTLFVRRNGPSTEPSPFAPKSPN